MNMPNWNPNSAQHKAQHGGYREKPTQKEVRANLDFWAAMSNPKDMVVVLATPGFGTPRLGTPVGTQLKLNF